ncbi:DUF881 domain-containing protein [Gracilibacillus dipsosauri]|uniref:DUF881 domain-containing protein n=1 Tax=Gracilibacillus dipsosauri TaxID=178340 RepID=A0A317L1R7_9BACI|nr:DUF881 domain-containing protein [Gracilibacillus dipsosauri]PWU68950.1 hypothetical protein DLJ74_11090 [Gracilibacillus dipsosauri]
MKMNRLKNKEKLWISFICLIIGFMIAILFVTNQQTDQRDTRDLWEIRTSIKEEQESQEALYNEIATAEKVLQEYNGQSENQQISSLKESIGDLKENAGLTEKKGQGITISLKPLFSNKENNLEYPQLNAELLQLLVNELNDYGATDIALGNERIINISPIRDVNNNVYVNGSSIGDLPTTIYVLTSDSNNLMDHMEVSELRDYFALEDIRLEIKKVTELVLPAYDAPINLDGLKVLDSIEEGEE